jgi:hypothetical protein
MKKIVTWFHIMKDMPFFDEVDPTETIAEEPVKEEAPVAEEAKPAKAVKKPAKAAAEKAVAADEPAAPKKAKAKK